MRLSRAVTVATCASWRRARAAGGMDDVPRCGGEVISGGVMVGQPRGTPVEGRARNLAVVLGRGVTAEWHEPISWAPR
jgi:hypothetical protein